MKLASANRFVMSSKQYKTKICISQTILGFSALMMSFGMMLFGMVYSMTKNASLCKID